MGFYSDRVFPFLVDHLLSHDSIMELRRSALTHARGDVLEIGFGTGLNLPCYPKGIKDIDIVEPSVGMNRRAIARVNQSPIRVHVHAIKGEKLPFDRASFDTVVTTFALCSVQDPEKVVSEIKRVLKPGCFFLFLEHGLSPDKKVARWQNTLNPLQKKLAAGCHLNRPMTKIIEDAGMTMRHVKNYYYKRAPKTLGYFYQGIARK